MYGRFRTMIIRPVMTLAPVLAAALAFSACSTTPLFGNGEDHRGPESDGAGDDTAAPDRTDVDTSTDAGIVPSDITAFHARYGFDPRELRSDARRSRLLWSRRILTPCATPPPAQPSWELPRRFVGGLMVTDTHVVLTDLRQLFLRKPAFCAQSTRNLVLSGAPRFRM